MATLRLKPGESSTQMIDLGAWYDFSEAATYTVQVRRVEHGGAVATSNPITITVLPPENASSAVTQTAASEPPFSLTLWVSPRAVSFPAGSVSVDVITKDTSDHKIFLRTESPSREQAGPIYKFDVQDTSGAAAPQTDLGSSSGIHGATPPTPALATPRGPGEALRLLPGEDWRDSVRLGKLYRFHGPGQYTIQARRWDDETQTWVKSNTVTLTVTP